MVYIRYYITDLDRRILNLEARVQPSSENINVNDISGSVGKINTMNRPSTTPELGTIFPEEQLLIHFTQYQKVCFLNVLIQILLANMSVDPAELKEQLQNSRMQKDDQITML